MIFVSYDRAAELANVGRRAIRAAVERGRLEDVQTLDAAGQHVNIGVTLDSLAGYYGWSKALTDQICIQHGVDPDTDEPAFLTVREAPAQLRAEDGDSTTTREDPK